MVSVMRSMTIWTSLFSDGEVFDLAVFVSTNMTKLTGCKESICLIYSSSVPHRFIAKHVHESGPGCVGDGFCKSMVLQHILYSKGFNVDDLVFVYQSRRNFVEVI